MASGEWGRSESKNYAIQPGISILCTNQQDGGRTRFGSPSLHFMPDRNTQILMQRPLTPSPRPAHAVARQGLGNRDSSWSLCPIVAAPMPSARSSRMPVPDDS